MRIIAKRTLREFWEEGRYADSPGPLEAWHEEVVKTRWENPQQVKK
ncbi:hypothetical protein MNBD_GAMMA21-1107 [hydrothermal vent metagenome]|uniref:Uncharacterized protein n=1 Tax=hydrothermal vent metagenome TaxID=652676 RepID=A0A3B1ACQ8_9ZZZZ